jgi:hypothetical protein
MGLDVSARGFDQTDNFLVVNFTHHPVVKNAGSSSSAIVGFEEQPGDLLVCYRLIDPGSEWRLHRHWYEQSAMGDLLGEDFGLVQIDKLYRCKDQAVAP